MLGCYTFASVLELAAALPGDFGGGTGCMLMARVRVPCNNASSSTLLGHGQRLMK